MLSVFERAAELLHWLSESVIEAVGVAETVGVVETNEFYQSPQLWMCY
jgi:hypothetical protein